MRALPIAAVLVLACVASRAHADDVIVDVAYGDVARLQALAARFQHLDVDRKRATARVVATTDDVAALRATGYRVTIDGTATAQMLDAVAGVGDKAITNFACYRTVEETYDAMSTLAASRPALARVVDIGPSWTQARGAGGYTMKALVLGNAATDTTVPDKPALVVTSAIHAREYATAELVTRFAEKLVAEHGVEDEATWLLDNFRLHFVLQSNPDGRKRAEGGVLWRKNVNGTNGTCASPLIGVDLNRNFPFHWAGAPNGSSPDPCTETYRGPQPASEPETQNLVRYIAGTPDAAGVYRGGVLPDLYTDGAGAAPSDYPGLYIDVHSAAGLVLWPWGDTTAPAPNGGALRALGRRMAFFNGYRPQQAYELYATDGTTDDTIYGVLGAPAYTFEIGTRFFENCATFESTVLVENSFALRYAARTIAAPYELGNGPVATIVSSPASLVAGEPLVVEAEFDDGRFSAGNGIEAVHAIASASAFVDRAPWHANAVAVPMTAVGAFDTSSEIARVTLDTAGLAPGMHTVYVQGRDVSGARGAPAAARVFVTAQPVTPQTGWYWNAAEPGRGFFVERNAQGRAFVATFHYRADGSATWFTGQGAFPNGALAAPIAEFRDGQTLTGSYDPPAAQPTAATFALRYPDATQAELAWPAGSVALARFPFAPSGTVEAPRAGAPETGWWWNAQEPGRGFAIEVQGDTIFVAGFMYADDGRATWYVTTGPMESIARYTGTWLAFRDGQAMGQPHRAPARAPDAGNVTIEFADARNASLTLPDGRVIPLTRFAF